MGYFLKAAAKQSCPDSAGAFPVNVVLPDTAARPTTVHPGTAAMECPDSSKTQPESDTEKKSPASLPPESSPSKAGAWQQDNPWAYLTNPYDYD